MNDAPSRRNRLMLWWLLGVALFLSAGTVAWVSFHS